MSERSEPAPGGRKHLNEALGYHLGFKLEDERVIARTTAERRVVARVVLEQGRGCGLFVFSAADNHLHTGLIASRRDAGALAHRVECALRRRLALPVAFRPVYVKALADQRHAYALLRYCLRQEAHHGTSCDPFYEATNLPDLLGLRVLGAYTAETVRTYLPRVRRGDLESMLGAAELDAVQPRIQLLAGAAAAALCLADLRGDTRDVVRARHAAVKVAAGSATDAQVSSCLGVSTRTVERLWSRPIDPALVRAVELQWRLRSAPRRDAAATDADFVGSDGHGPP